MIYQYINFINTTFTLYWNSAFGPRYLLSKGTSLTLASDSEKNLNPFPKALDFCGAVYVVSLSLFILWWFQGLKSAYKSTETFLAMAANLEGY